LSLFLEASCRRAAFTTAWGYTPVHRFDAPFTGNSSRSMSEVDTAPGLSGTLEQARRRLGPADVVPIGAGGAAKGKRRMSKREWILTGLLACVFTPAVLAMAEVWRSVGYYSHGFLIPVVSYAAFHPIAGRLGPTGRDLRGYLLVLGALGVYLLGLGAGSTPLQGLGFVAAVAGLVVSFWGLAGLRRLAFPVGFLLFMVPLPPELLSPLIVKLQLVVSSVSVEVLQVLGYSVLREGNVLVLPGGKSLFVAEACSGITSIVTLTPLGVTLAYFTESTWGRRLVIIVAVIPLAMLGNLIRVVMTVLAAEAYGVERVTQSALHDLAGLLTFALMCLALVAVGVLQRRLCRPAGDCPAGRR
jgi:exosortase